MHLSETIDAEATTDKPGHTQPVREENHFTPLPFDYHITDDDLADPDFGDDSDMRRRVKMQALILQRFWSRWRHEYRTTGTNKQSIQKGEVVLVHDDSPRSTWKLAVIESLIKGGDGLVRAANIRTKTGCTNRPITKLYPLEVSTNATDQENPPRNDDVNQQATAVASSRQNRLRRATASEALRKISEWARSIRVPPEDVEEYSE